MANIFRNTYATAQTDLAIITPGSGKSIYVWGVYCQAEAGATIEFATSSLTFCDLDSSWPTSFDNHRFMEGAADEVLTLNCGVNTTIAILYEEF